MLSWRCSCHVIEGGQDRPLQLSTTFSKPQPPLRPVCPSRGALVIDRPPGYIRLLLDEPFLDQGLNATPYRSRRDFLHLCQFDHGGALTLRGQERHKIFVRPSLARRQSVVTAFGTFRPFVRFDQQVVCQRRRLRQSILIVHEVCGYLGKGN